MDSPVYSHRLKYARLFLAGTILSCIALLEAVYGDYPDRQYAAIGFGILTPFYLVLALYWYWRLWQWVQFRKQHPAMDNSDLNEMLRQATRTPEQIDVAPSLPFGRDNVRSPLATRHDYSTSTLADAFREPPATN